MTKKIIVGDFVVDDIRRVTEWCLPAGIKLIKDDITPIDNVEVWFGDEPGGVLSKEMAQRVFDVILYPPGSVPSPEPSNKRVDPYLEQQQKDDQWEIPRQDIK